MVWNTFLQKPLMSRSQLDFINHCEQATSDGHQFSFQMLQMSAKSQFLPPRTTAPRPLSESTEILDTDFDSDYGEEFPDDSPRRSLAAESISTASTPDDIKTPDSTGLTGFHFHFDDNPVRGPSGPHLFRLSADSSPSVLGSCVEVDLILAKTPTSATTPLYQAASKLEPERRDTPVPVADSKPSKASSSRPPSIEVTFAEEPPKENYPVHQAVPDSQRVSEGYESEVVHWSPQDVVMWMQRLGFDESVVEKFFINDISGAILIDLQSEDLKELDIQSFGKRHRLMNSIRELRYSALISEPYYPQPNPVNRISGATPQSVPTPPPPAPAPAPTPNGACSGTESSSSTTPTEENRPDSKTKKHRRRHRHRRAEDITPADSVSIVGIEQLLPNVHSCSKGEECRKWQKQQAKLERLARGLPAESVCGSRVLTGDPGNPSTAPNLLKTPNSDTTPSVIASSDLLGPGQTPDFRLCEEKLTEVKPRDPQENVRHFLHFQRLSKLQPVDDPRTPPREDFVAGENECLESGKTSASLAENLRHLPKLRIPSTHGTVAASNFSPNLSAQRTITPSILRKKHPFAQPPIVTAVEAEQRPSLYSSALSPSEFYRQDPHYEQRTPFSEIDVPVTAIPFEEIARETSQSVPPNMRFGGNLHHMADPIARPASTKAENHRRNNSIQANPNFRALARLDEREAMDPIDTLEDLERTPRAAHCKSNPFSPINGRSPEVTHSGPMKKRKTTRLLRHEWEEHHFTLRGTQLAMYNDQEASRRDSKALEYIDVDDYAVACSSLVSSSKLTAAFKKTMLKRKENIHGEAAFAFSLIPAPNGSATCDRKTLFSNGKSHHFAVRTRDERIDWMRELMLAKALKRGRDSGATLKVNGNNV